MSSLDIRCADNHLRHPERIIFGNDDANLLVCLRTRRTEGPASEVYRAANDTVFRSGWLGVLCLTQWPQSRGTIRITRFMKLV